MLKEYISKYISYKEVIRSNTAVKLGIDNTPTKEQLVPIRELSNKVFDPLRVWVGNKVKVNSFFRSKKLNTELKGSYTSQHMVNIGKGAAMDIDDTYGHKKNWEMFHYIKDNLDFDQLIAEFPEDDGNPRWLHVSYNKGKNRNKVLIAVKRKVRRGYELKGKLRTIYLDYYSNRSLVKQ
jgi:zinc D-Ala-D-Ala carboxypeptidase